MVRRRLPLILGLGLVALLALVWVPPALAGPAIDCGRLSQAECDEAVPVVVRETEANVWYYHLVPVTSVHLHYTQGCPLGYTVTFLDGFGWASSGGVC
jgi:hypothetical protein